MRDYLIHIRQNKDNEHASYNIKYGIYSWHGLDLFRVRRAEITFTVFPADFKFSLNTIYQIKMG